MSHVRDGRSAKAVGCMPKRLEEHTKDEGMLKRRTERTGDEGINHRERNAEGRRKMKEGEERRLLIR